MSVWVDIRSKSLGKSKILEHTGEEISSVDVDPVDMHNEIVSMMKTGIVHFKYMKKDIVKKNGTVIKGTEREAWGTKYMPLVDKIPHGGDCPPKRVGYTIYFDVEKGDWRAFMDVNLIGYWDEVYSYTEFEKLTKE